MQREEEASSPFLPMHALKISSFAPKNWHPQCRLACMVGVRKGRGRELGRESTHAQIPPSPSPFNACHAGYTQASCSNGLLHSARTTIQLYHHDWCFLDNKEKQPCFTRDGTSGMPMWVPKNAFSYLLWRSL